MKLHRTDGWKKVAEFVGDGKTVEQCQSRWYVCLARVGEGLLKDVKWTEEDVSAILF